MDMNNIKVFLSEEEIKNKVAQLGKQISDDYRGEDKNLILIAILKGSVVFLSDLMRNIDIDLSIDFMVVSSYGSGTESSGNIKIVKDLDIISRTMTFLLLKIFLTADVLFPNLSIFLKCVIPNRLKYVLFLINPTAVFRMLILTIAVSLFRMSLLSVTVLISAKNTEIFRISVL